MGNNVASLMGKHFDRMKHDTQYKTSKPKQETALRKIFTALDANGNGVIEGREVHELLAAVKKSYLKATEYELSKSEIDALVKVADTNGDKEIDFTEFKLMMFCVAQMMTK
mmetsp:Transcript_15218/g.19299  ORF Transcript_15218/g.19299 Transcript_15218/m.19299 type:complete len:111 (-) Transcript_15218:103-435(-)|eukprot:CAMPEP_0206191910 /NCGR_PEP_ID=MMETSP0166-20121206/5640_1 /ASSEMBLY_ACC=CAM_ASM_000260 /TAXON_ID=95228 /ORGANISM="Vannella robusta, Strain DIVA3 518/3/11/1/6" /LENGTH=110 /DNA_ID=CAMNT_0053608297 /DNA_START=89 /DNA_END=421 /DNA_ORIENTATION=+